MRILLLLTILLPSLALAGLVEVNSSQYLRESGNPQAQYLEVTLDNAGEIRVSNVNLQDGYIELAASTDVLLNGSSLMQPFSLPTGGSAVFPLEAGTHYLEVTLRGKHGGGLKVSFYENKPDAPIQGKGWELLDDGTLLHRKTGLIWHRNPNSPGSVGRFPPGQINFTDASQITVEQYIKNLNSGIYGSDMEHGNAGINDWRLPTVDELISLIDWRFGDACEANDPEAQLCLNGTRLTDWSGDAPFSNYGEPFFVDLWFDGICFNHLSSSVSVADLAVGDPYHWAVLFESNRRSVWPNLAGCIWPVRGGTPE